MALNTRGATNNIEKLRQATKRGAGGMFWRAKADAENTIRVLDEPGEKWIPFFEHFDDANKYYPCDNQSCVGCESGAKRQERYAFNILEVATGQVMVAIVPKSVADALLSYWKKSASRDADRTLRNVDYDIERTGTGMDTTYTVMRGLKETPLRLARYEKDMQDVEALLTKRMNEVNGVVDDEEEPEEVEEQEVDGDQFDDMDRSELKKFIRASDPGFKFYPSQDDDELRDIARDLGVAEEEPEEEDEDEEPPVQRPSRNGGTVKRSAPSPAPTGTRKIAPPGVVRRQAEAKVAAKVTKSVPASPARRAPIRRAVAK